MANKQMNFSVGIKTTYDAAGVNKLKADLTSLANLGNRKNYFAQFASEAPTAIQAANTLKNALTQAYNPKLGTATLNRFNQSIKQSGMNLKEVQSGLHHFGVQGDMAFVNATTSLLKMNTVAKNTNTAFDKMFTTLKNTITWGISSTLWNNITGSVQKTYYYIKDLDTALNDIRIVTGKSNDEMAAFAKNANEAAKALGTTTKSYAEGALIYYQQGLSDEEVKVRNDITAKTAMVTGQSMEQVSEQLTAVWNGYKASADEAELYVDRLAAVAATTASDLEELSTGMSKVASSAANLGVTESQLSAILATTISVTRQAPEAVGTAYKTIFARISDIKAGLDTETSLGNYTSKMAAMGISVLDTTGNLRDMGEVIEEIGYKWETMTREQQISLAQTMAGTRQYNNLVALFDNWSNYVKTLGVAEGAMGTLAEQHNIALDSINNRLNILKATWEDLYQNLISADDIKTLISAITEVADKIAFLVKSVGGLKTILPAVTSLLLQIGSARIGQEIGTYVNEFIRMSESAKNLEKDVANLRSELNKEFKELFPNEISESQTAYVDQLLGKYQNILQYKEVMNSADEKSLNILIDQEKEVIQMRLEYEEIARNLSAINTKGQQSLIPADLQDTYSLLANKNLGFSNLIESQDVSQLNNFSAVISSITNEIEKEIIAYNNLSDAKKKQYDADQIIQDALTNDIGALSLNAEQVKVLAQEFSKLGGDVSAMEAFVNRLKQIKTISKEAASACEQWTEGNKILASSWQQVEESLNVKKLVQDISNLTGVMTSLGMVITNITNLVRVWTDESLSIGEKILRTITSLTFILPSVLKSVQTISTFTKALTKAIDVQNGKILVQITGEEKLAKLAQLRALEEEKITLEQQKQTAMLKARQYGEKAELENANVRKAVIGSKEYKNAKNRAKYALNKKLEQDAIASKASQRINEINGQANGINGELKNGVPAQGAGNTGGLAGLIASAPQAAIAITAVVVALAALVSGMAIAEDLQKKIAKRELEDLKKLKEKTDEREKEVRKINDLAKTYSSLKNQLDENTITEVEYRNQVLSLTKDIEDQTIKLQMLRGEYNSLDETMQKIVQEQNTQLIGQYNEQMAQANSAMVAAGVQGTSFGQDLWKSPLLNGGGGLSGWNLLPGIGGLVNGIGSFVKGIGKNNQVISKSLDISANAELKKYFEKNGQGIINTKGPGGYQLTGLDADNIIETYEFIDKAIQDNAHLANTETLKELTTIRDNMQEAYNIQKEAQDKMNELKKENLVYKTLDENMISSAEDYAKTVSKMANEAIAEDIFGKDEYDEARVWANGALSAVSEEAIQWSKSEALIDTLLNSVNLNEKESEELAKSLSNYSDAQLRLLIPVFFTLGKDTAKSYIDGMNEFLSKEGVQEITKTQERLLAQQTLESAIGLANESKTFNTKEIQKLLQDAEINTQDFQDMNYGNQMLTAIWTHNKMGLTPEEADDLRELYKSQQEEAQRIFEEVQTEALDNGDWYSIENLNKGKEGGMLSVYDKENNTIKSLNVTKETVMDLGKRYLEAGNSTATFSSEEKALWERLIQLKAVKEEDLEQTYLQNDAYQEAKQNVDDLANAILNVNAQEQSWSKVREDAAKVMEDYSGSLDDLQSAYKALSTAEKEWNLNEGFSIDTLQSLLKMNPAYIEALEMEGNQFKVNTERLNEIARAEAVAAVNAAEMAQQALFLDAVEKGANSTEWMQIFAMQTYAGAIEDTTSALWGQVQALAEAKLATNELTQAQYDSIIAAAQQQQAYFGKARHIAMNVDVTKDTKKSGKSKSKDEKNYRDEFDRYWEYLKAIEKVQNAIDELNKKEKNLYGKEKISLLKNKNELLNQQVGTYNDLYEEQKREQSELIAKLTQQGVTFNGTGEITNYAQRTSQALAEYNEAVRKYNAGMLSDTAFELAEKSFEDFKKSIDRYDKLYYTEMKDTLDKIEDINREVLANNLEAWEIDIKLNIDWEALQREWTDFLHNMDKDFTLVYEDLGDELTRIMKKATTYTEGSGTLETDLKAIYDVMSEIDKLESGEQSTMFESISQAQEKLKSLNSDLMKDTEGLHKLWEEAYKAYLEGIDQLNEKFEEQMGYYERIDKELQHQQNLIGLLYGDEAYDMMDALYRNQEKNQIAEIDSLRRQRDLWKEQWEAAEEGSQEQLKYYELMVEAQDNLNDGVEKYIELLKKDATNAIDNILNNYDKWLTNGQGLKTIKADWDDMSKYIDKYFDSIESTYHIETLASKIRQGIDKQDSVNAQKKLQDLYDKEIKYLKEKEELTEYDIKAAEIRYNIALKEIALQEAQEAKNSMKVTRDTNGNWTYQYVADLGDEEEKRQQLSDEIYKLYELANDAYNDNLTNMITLQEEYSTRMRELALEEINTGRDMTAEKDKLNQWYFENYERLAGENLIYQQDMADAGAGVLKDAYDNNVFELEDYTETQKELIKKMTEANIQDFQNLSDCVRDNVNGIGENTREMLKETVPEWTSSAKEIADAWNADDGQSIKAQVINATQDILDATRDYQEGLDELQITAQVDFDEIINTIEDTTDATEDLKDMVEELCNDNDLDDYKDAIDNIKDAWNGVKDSIQEAIRQIEIYLKKVGEASNVKVNTLAPSSGWNSNSGSNGPGNGPGTSNPGSDSTSNNGNGNKADTWWFDQTARIAYVGTGYGKDAQAFAQVSFDADTSTKEEWIRQYGNLFLNQTLTNLDSNAIYAKMKPGGEYFGLSYEKALEEEMKKYKGSKISKVLEFASGGYTGDWAGGDGRLAMLHSKEIVLNEADTTNFLSAVSMIRQIASFGTSIQDNIMSGIDSFVNQFSGGVGSIKNGNNSSKQTIFNITAPITSTATTDEIQNAILQLPNLATQFASRNAF